MFKIHLLFLLLAMSTPALAQQTTPNGKYFAGLKAGWSGATAPQSLGLSTNVRTGSELQSFSYGAGLRFGLEAGLWLHPNLGVSLGLDYLEGRQSDEIMNFNALYTFIAFPPPAPLQFHSVYRARQLQLMPALVLTTSRDARFYLSAALGAVLPLAGERTEELWAQYSSGGNSPELDTRELRRFEYTDKADIGFQGSLTAGYRLSGRLALQLQLQGISLSATPEKAVLTERTINGQPANTPLPRREREIRFVETLPFGSQSEDEPLLDFARKQPLSSVGFNLGLMVKLP